jgi:hypothetical protein
MKDKLRRREQESMGEGSSREPCRQRRYATRLRLMMSPTISLGKLASIDGLWEKRERLAWKVPASELEREVTVDPAEGSA